MSFEHITPQETLLSMDKMYNTHGVLSFGCRYELRIRGGKKKKKKKKKNQEKKKKNRTNKNTLKQQNHFAQISMVRCPQNTPHPKAETVPPLGS